MHWLGAIRFFEAAARLGSFVRAADELHLTHGAISRQIRQLEEALGVPLFERRNRAVFLTEAGRTLHAAATQSLAGLAEAVARIRAPAPRAALVLSCEPTIAMRWLIPRLSRFAAAYPDIALHLMAAGGPIDFRKSGVDVALRRNDFPFDTRWHTRELAQECVGPVCRPDLATADPAAVTRLHTRTRPDAWQRWQQFEAGEKAGPAVQIGRSDQWYEHFYLSLQAAAAGLGWAMASRLMAADELADGRLAAPLGFVADGSSYYLIAPAPFAQDARLAALHGWLRTEMESG
ncbi:MULTISPECIES: LysR substrate-binding domain-containing protein [Cupriavidus]|uniref:LysR family transcriptional regulator n=1 Tax=Cupriavidus campinensis TaxID=151783 RepID=A0AAE9I6K8_9BURK|nr:MULTISPECIES: LysR substrate-binding domain-containing protein [Cupriavidus]TSP09395.1 LysR family transcriptional regulator [Cupriavidus campinensis]URF08229.1 LysR substrate-binding domain-containing protein [Cupriavidus campinensis]